MQSVRRLSLPELTAKHLGKGLREGRWHGVLPGVARLALELDVSRNTLRAALRRLQAEGLLDARGPGRSRGISHHGTARPYLRVGILLHDARLTDDPQTSQVVLEIQNKLDAAGHSTFFCKKSQSELRHDVHRVSRQIAETPADAWIVISGSHEVLEWFARRAVPSIALYGRSDGLAMARTGPDKVPAYLAATRQLIALGHRRIVLIARESRRKPTPGNLERAFLAELATHGILTGKYHLPNWEETPQGFSNLLGSLFQSTPPTALIIDENTRYVAAAEFLARRRIHVPEQVSLVSTDDDASLTWCHPRVAHMGWDNAPIVRHVVRWISSVRKGNPDRKTINYPAEFVPGGSIGPAPKR